MSATLLAGCTVGPNYRPPQMPVEDSFGPSASSATSQPSVLTTSPIAAAR